MNVKQGQVFWLSSCLAAFPPFGSDIEMAKHIYEVYSCGYSSGIGFLGRDIETGSQSCLSLLPGNLTGFPFQTIRLVGRNRRHYLIRHKYKEFPEINKFFNAPTR